MYMVVVLLFCLLSFLVSRVFYGTTCARLHQLVSSLCVCCVPYSVHRPQRSPPLIIPLLTNKMHKVHEESRRLIILKWHSMRHIRSLVRLLAAFALRQTVGRTNQHTNMIRLFVCVDFVCAPSVITIYNFD